MAGEIRFVNTPVTGNEIIAFNNFIDRLSPPPLPDRVLPGSYTPAAVEGFCDLFFSSGNARGGFLSLRPPRGDNVKNKKRHARARCVRIIRDNVAV